MFSVVRECADLQGQGNPCPKKKRYFPGLSVFFNPPFSPSDFTPSTFFFFHLLVSTHLRTSTFLNLACWILTFSGLGIPRLSLLPFWCYSLFSDFNFFGIFRFTHNWRTWQPILYSPDSVIFGELGNSDLILNY